MVAVSPTGLGILPLINGTPPCNGAKVIPFIMDFNAASVYDFDFTQQQQGGQIDYIQTAFIDNTLNAQNLIVTVGASQQRIQVPKNSAGYFTLLAPNPLKCSFTTTGLVLVYVGFINFYIPPTVWAAP